MLVHTIKYMLRTCILQHLFVFGAVSTYDYSPLGEVQHGNYIGEHLDNMGRSVLLIKGCKEVN